jgi:uncharacterized protein YgiM (DUF1202 family)
MRVKSKIIYAVFSVLIVGILGLLPIFEVGNAHAFKQHHRRKAASYSRPIPGKMVARLPKAHVTVRVGRARFFFHSGVFYRRGRGGFIVVHAPLGAAVARLPMGCSTVVIDGNAYYTDNGVFYQKSPSAYVVVNPPISTQTQVSAGSRVAVTALLLNVRSGPGMQFAITRTVRQGNILSVHGVSPGWLYVRLSNRNFGWVSDVFTAPAVPSASG